MRKITHAVFQVLRLVGMAGFVKVSTVIKLNLFSSEIYQFEAVSTSRDTYD